MHIQLSAGIDCPEEMRAVNGFEICCTLLNGELRENFRQYRAAEEIRLRCGKPASVLIAGKEHSISGMAVCENDIMQIIELATGASMHSAASSISLGYIDYRGVRIGICGQAICSGISIKGFRKYTSLSIRIPHEVKDVIPKEIVAEFLAAKENLIIAAPPGGGKTTALRELVRNISEKGLRISLIDERGELTGSEECYDLGRCTDVLAGIPKATAAMMVLRGMNPQIIAMDEISHPEDVDAVFEIVGCGVSVFATLHGSGCRDMLSRPAYRRLFDSGVFSKILTININNGKREYKLERIPQ